MKTKTKKSKTKPISWQLSKHDQECDFCGGFINKGDMIVVTEGTFNWHEVCYEEGLEGQEMSVYQKALWEGRGA
jgi:hypothetical protein